jgi:hypothetical protein
MRRVPHLTRAAKISRSGFPARSPRSEETWHAKGVDSKRRSYSSTAASLKRTPVATSCKCVEDSSLCLGFCWIRVVRRLASHLRPKCDETSFARVSLYSLRGSTGSSLNLRLAQGTALALLGTWRPASRVLSSVRTLGSSDRCGWSSRRSKDWLAQFLRPSEVLGGPEIRRGSLVTKRHGGRPSVTSAI